MSVGTKKQKIKRAIINCINDDDMMTGIIREFTAIQKKIMNEITSEQY